MNERVGDLSELIYWFLNIGVIVTAFYSTRLMLLVFLEDLASTQETCTEGVTTVVWFPLCCLPSINISRGLLVQPFVINNFLQQEIFVMEGNNIIEYSRISHQLLISPSMDFILCQLCWSVLVYF